MDRRSPAGPEDSYRLRVVVFFGRRQWVAQALEHDLAAQAASIEELPSAFAQALSGELEMASRLGREPLHSLPPAPDRYFAMWDGSRPVRDRRPWLDLPGSIRQMIAALALDTRATPVSV